MPEGRGAQARSVPSPRGGLRPLQRVHIESLSPGFDDFGHDDLGKDAHMMSAISA